jgi:hypothetical protein
MVKKSPLVGIIVQVTHWLYVRPTYPISTSPHHILNHCYYIYGFETLFSISSYVQEEINIYMCDIDYQDTKYVIASRAPCCVIGLESSTTVKVFNTCKKCT